MDIFFDHLLLRKNAQLVMQLQQDQPQMEYLVGSGLSVLAKSTLIKDAIKLWNSAPAELKSSANYNQLKIAWLIRINM